MFRSHWLCNWLEVSRSRKDRRRPAARCRKTIRLMLESLEERLTPSGGNPTVTQTAGGYTALTTAVAADTADNINYVIQITNSFQFASGGQVNISKLGIGSTLTIEGQSGNNFTLTGNGNRLFNIDGTGENVTFADLTLTGGAVTNGNGMSQGGAILDQGGNVMLSKMRVENNSVTSNSMAVGGGVYVSEASTVAISDSTFNENSAIGKQGADGTSPGANGSDGGIAYGGGLYVDGRGWTATLTGDTFSGNRAIAGNGGNGAAGQNASGTNASGGNGGNGGQSGWALGGGAYFLALSGSSHLTIANDTTAPTTNPSQFLDNSIQSGAGGNGGAGGTSTGTAKNANGGAGGMGNQAIGGALFLSTAGGTLVATINNTTISGNKASDAKGGTGGAAGTGGTGSAGVAGNRQFGRLAAGGGLALENNVVATINNITVANNSAVAVPGTFDFAYGGGIYVVNGDILTIQGGSVIQSNIVKGGGFALGGGVYVSGASTVTTIADSTLRRNSAQGENGADGTAAGQNGGNGGTAHGGGLYVLGNAWDVTLRGDTLSGNSAIGGNGGNGAAGSNATTPNTSGGSGGNGGKAGGAAGGAAYFAASVDSNFNTSGTLTILNDLTSPTTHPSTIIGNSVQAGTDGNGGAGGDSTGTANNANGGKAGIPGYAIGGGVFITGTQGSTATIGNTTFYGNTVSSSKLGTYDVAIAGGGLYVQQVNFTMVNSTLAQNTVNGATQGQGGGIAIYNVTTVTLENNTITQNMTNGGPSNGSGAFIRTGGALIPAGNTTLVNNLIQGNQNIGSPALDLVLSVFAPPLLSNTTNNFIGSMSANAVSTTSNIVGNTQVQLGSVVGVDANGNPTGGPIYYPLLPGVASIGAGTTSVLNTIAGVQGTTPASAVDEIGNPRSSNGSIDIGAVQALPSPPSPPPVPAPPPPSSPPAPPVLNVPPLLAWFNSLLRGIETVNANGTETIADSFFGIPLIVSTFDSSGSLMSVTLFGFNIPFLFV